MAVYGRGLSSVALQLSLVDHIGSRYKADSMQFTTF